MNCPKCGSEDSDEQDVKYDPMDGWIDFYCICADCDCYFRVECSMKIDNTEEIE